MLSGADRTYTWNSENKPLTINNSATGAVATFSYGPGGEILTENLYGRTVSQVVTHIGGIYDIVEKVDTVTRASGEILQRAYVAGVCVVTQSASAAEAKIDKNKKVWKRYMHGDHLGSVEAITDERGNVLQRYDYDVWGAQRNTQSVSDNGPVPITERGFTGHEELADLGLVHMIGRVYDPLIGRFCSADPTVQFPSNSQSYNRYSYVLNNPLSLTDPTGFFSIGNIWNGITGAASSIAHAVANIGKSVGKWVAQNWRTVVVVAATVVVSVVTAGVLSGPMALVASTAIGGAVNGGLTTALYGGSASEIFVSALKGIGAAVGGAVYNMVQGDWRGAAISAGASLIGMVGIGGTGSLAVAGRAVMAAAVGGTVSKLNGGSFANGAITAAFASVMGDAARMAMSRGAKIDERCSGTLYKDKLLVGLYGAGGDMSSNNEVLREYINENGGIMLDSRNTAEVTEFIESQNYDRLILVGYSRGGQSVVNVTNALGADGYTVDALVTIDPYAFGSPLNLKYDNVTAAANFYQRNPTDNFLWTPFNSSNPYRGSTVSSPYIHVGGFRMGAGAGHVEMVSQTLNTPECRALIDSLVR